MGDGKGCLRRGLFAFEPLSLSNSPAFDGSSAHTG